MRQRVLAILAIVVAGLAALAVRVIVEGRGALADGDAALADKRPVEALAAYEAAARWYLPGAPHVDEAYARMIEIAERDRAVALPAWRGVRGAALATRSLWTPHGDDLARADAEIALLVSADPEGSPAAGNNPAERQAWHAMQLARDPRPSRGHVAVAIAGIVAWLAGIGILIRHPVKRRALVGAALALAGLMTWGTALYNV